MQVLLQGCVPVAVPCLQLASNPAVAATLLASNGRAVRNAVSRMCQQESRLQMARMQMRFGASWSHLLAQSSMGL